MKSISFKSVNSVFQFIFITTIMKLPNKDLKVKFALAQAILNFFMANFISKQFEDSIYNPERKKNKRFNFTEIKNVLSHISKKQMEANIDPLTNIPNRRALEKDLKSLEQKHLSVLILDVDHFKHINDTYGHLKGDEVLSEIGAILRQYVQEKGACYRYGGEEFVITLPNVKKQNAKIIANHIRSAIERDIFINDYSITVSIGIASGQKPKKLLRIADKNLYKAKRNGRNQVQL